MSSKILIRKNHLSAYFGGSKETGTGETASDFREEENLRRGVGGGSFSGEKEAD